MKYFDWSEEKNNKLIRERSVSFEIIIGQIETGFLLDVLQHPNQIKYKGQRIFIVEYDDYVYLVPFIEDEKKIFLKTIIPSRKATKNI